MPLPQDIQILSVIFGALFLLLSIYKPFFGLLSYFIIMAGRVGLYFPALGRIRIELIVAIIVLLQLFREKGAFQKLRASYSSVNRYMFLFLAVIFFSFFQALDYDVSWNNGVLEFVKVFLFYVMIVSFVRDEHQVKIFLWTFAFVTIFLGYEGLYLYFQGESSYVFQDVEVAIASKGFASGHVAAANMQLQCLPIMLYLVLSESRILFRGIAGLLAGLSILGVIASGSRGGFAGLILVAILFVYFSRRRVPALLVCVALFFVSIPLLPGSYLSWMSTLLERSDGSATSRATGLINGIEMMIRRPILGVGPECYPVARKRWFGWGLEAHNHLGQLLGDLGLTGTIIWSLLLYHVFKNLATAKKILREKLSERSDMLFVITGIQVALLVRLFEGYGSHSLYIFFWYMIAALSIVILKTVQKENHLAKDEQVGVVS